MHAPLSPAEAMDAFRGSAAARNADPRLVERLIEVQTLLGDDLAWLEQALVEVLQSGVAPASDAALHLVSRGGKRIRPLSLLLSAACFGAIPEPARQLALVAELVHSATLLHDDVTDEGLERRGAPTSRRIWGNGISVLSGDFLLIKSLELTQAISYELLEDLLTTMRELVEGEIIQLRGRTTLNVSEDTYFRILRGKTASLFAWSTRSGAKLTAAGREETECLARFGEQVGIAFQLVDDLLDYESSHTGKTSLADLREGKLMLPLVLAVQRRPELLPHLERIHTGDLSEVALVGQQVIESGACDEVRTRARSVTDAAIAELSALPSSSAKQLLEQIARDLARRAE